MLLAEQKVGVVDYGTGNLASIVRAFERIGVRALVTSHPVDMRDVDKLVLPGVGHFGRTMDQLRRRRLLDAIHHAAHSRRIPVLGICLGMQLMTARSEEGDAVGLDWVAGEVVRFEVDDARRYKVPHIGWARVDVAKPHPLFDGVSHDAEFYFAHAYKVDSVATDVVIGESEYSRRFTSAISFGNLYGVQFHPEKSHDAGQRLLHNFVSL